jgi:probable phosphoglycerate mutase
LIYLLRHGETEWNRERRIQGRKESRLTPLGERQARAMAALVADMVARDPSASWRLVASPLGRTRATAQAVADRLGLPIELDERLAEIGCGEWEGLIRDEVPGITPELMARREWFFGAPGGETYEDVWDRVSDWIADLPPEPERRVIAVSHGVAGRLLRGAYAGLSRDDTLMQDVPQDAIYRLAGGDVHRLDCEPVGEETEA